jgi:LPXTG-motif cell wall-anchored protein
MKAFKDLFATLVAGICSLPYLLFAQDEGTYIDNLGVQDSAYMEQNMLAEGAQGSGTGTVVIIILAAIIIIGIVAYFIKKRKK